MVNLQNKDPMFEKVEIIVRATQELGEVIADFHPDTPVRWEILEKLVQAHKVLMTIELSAFVQPPLMATTGGKVKI